MPCSARKRSHECALKSFSTPARCRCTRAFYVSAEPLPEAGPAGCAAVVAAFGAGPAGCTAVVAGFETEPVECVVAVVVFGVQPVECAVAVEVMHHGFVGAHLPVGIWRSGQNSDVRLTRSSRRKKTSRIGVSAARQGGSQPHPALAGWGLFVSGPVGAEPIPQIANVEPPIVVPDFVQVVAFTIRERIACRVEEALDQIG